MEQIENLRRIGSRQKVEQQMKFVDFALGVAPVDSTDMWKAVGNEEPQKLTDARYSQFMTIVKRLNPAI